MLICNQQVGGSSPSTSSKRNIPKIALQCGFRDFYFSGNCFSKPIKGAKMGQKCIPMWVKMWVKNMGHRVRNIVFLKFYLLIRHE